MVNVILVSMFGWIALVLALLVTPLLAVRLCLPRASFAATAAATLTGGIILNTLVPLLLHVLRIPVDVPQLAAAHVLAAALLVPALVLVRRRPLIPAPDVEERWLAPLFCGFTALALPYTPLAGIDTYKWLDLATAVEVEQCIPWLVHPMSLLGFTGRSYPSAQPLLLASVRILGGLGVEAGYGIVSLYIGALGMLAAFLLGRRLFPQPRRAAWTALLYVASPVFMRYAHWATGRGLLVALMPLLVLAAVDLPRLRAFGLLLVLLPLAALAHKTGLFAIVPLLACILGGLVLPRRDLRFVAPLLALPVLALAVLMAPSWGPAPSGRLLGAARMGLTRLGWLLPLGLVGIFCAPGWFVSGALRRCLPALLLTAPLLTHDSMYGALLALVFVTAAAAHGLFWFLERLPALRAAAVRLTLFMTILGAVVIVMHRSAGAAPWRIRAAARFLDAYDPSGPYRILSARWAPQIQGYVRGAPRFEANAADRTRVVLHAPPALDPRTPPRELLRRYVAYARHLFGVHGTHADYYGPSPRFYHVVIDGIGSRPQDGVTIYDRDGVQILRPRRQTVTLLPPRVFREES